jgi:carbamoyltransferase
VQDKLFFKSMLKKAFSGVGEWDSKKTPLLFTPHHLSHAASAFYPSGFGKAAILNIDGVGEWATASIGVAEGTDIRILKELHFPHSIGMLYSAFTYFLGFKVNSGEYKLMGLSPFGRQGSEVVERFKNIITSELIARDDEGGLRLNMRHFSYLHTLRMIDDRDWEQMFGIPVRKPSDPIRQEHCDLALAIQEVTEDLVLNLARQAKALSGADYLCYAGGVALNCVANGKLLLSGLFKEIYVPSSPGDSGGAIGAALSAWHIYFKGAKGEAVLARQNRTAYLGPAFSDKDIRSLCRKYAAVAEVLPNDTECCKATAALLKEGKVVGWFQGRMEFGPRALGNRSILASPLYEQMQSRLNLKIKFREDFRPFAPVVAAEYATEFYPLPYGANYMEFVVPLDKAHRFDLPEGFQQSPWQDKLQTPRSPLQAITHVDFTARPQTVSSETNPLLHQLLLAFREVSGYPVLVNTSFNVRGEPIVCTPEDAYACFMQTDMDVLVMGHHLFRKEEQPATFREYFQKRNFMED